MDGDAISFVEMLNFQDNEIRITYTGKLSADGNEIKFTREVGDFGKMEIVAKRERHRSSGGACREDDPDQSRQVRAGQRR